MHLREMFIHSSHQFVLRCPIPNAAAPSMDDIHVREGVCSTVSAALSTCSWTPNYSPSRVFVLR